MSVPFSMMRRGLIGGAVVWAAALPGATFAASQAHPSVLSYLATLAVYAAGSIVCHQIDTRSFHLWGHQMPVCARCTGIYVGAALAAIFMALPGEGRRGASGVGILTVRRPLLVVFVAAAPMVASLVFEWATGITPPNLARAATGLIAGFAVSGVVVRGLAAPAEADPVVN